MSRWCNVIQTPKSPTPQENRGTPQLFSSEECDNLDKYNQFINELSVRIEGGWSPADTLPYDEDLLRLTIGLSPRIKTNKEFYPDSDQAVKRNWLAIQPISGKKDGIRQGVDFYCHYKRRTIVLKSRREKAILGRQRTTVQARLSTQGRQQEEKSLSPSRSFHGHPFGSYKPKGQFYSARRPRLWWFPFWSRCERNSSDQLGNPSITTRHHGYRPPGQQPEEDFQDGAPSTARRLLWLFQ